MEFPVALVTDEDGVGSKVAFLELWALAEGADAQGHLWLICHLPTRQQKASFVSTSLAFLLLFAPNISTVTKQLSCSLSMSWAKAILLNATDLLVCSSRPA